MLSRAIVIWSLLELACGRRKPEAEKQALVQTAAAYAKRLGFRVEKYDVVSVKIEKGTAYVLFQGRNGLPGDHFTVLVDVHTGKATELIPGE